MAAPTDTTTEALRARVAKLEAALRICRELLDNTRGDINPERGYAEEREAELVEGIALIDRTLA